MMCDTPVPCAITAVLQTQLGSTSYVSHKNVPCSLSGGTESAASQQQLEHQQCRTPTYAAQCKPAAHQGDFKPGQQVSCIYNRRLHPSQWFNCKSRSHGLDKIYSNTAECLSASCDLHIPVKAWHPSLSCPLWALMCSATSQSWSACGHCRSAAQSTAKQCKAADDLAPANTAQVQRQPSRKRARAAPEVKAARRSMTQHQNHVRRKVWPLNPNAPSSLQPLYPKS